MGIQHKFTLPVWSNSQTKVLFKSGLKPCEYTNNHGVAQLLKMANFMVLKLYHKHTLLTGGGKVFLIISCLQVTGRNKHECFLDKHDFYPISSFSDKILRNKKKIRVKPIQHIRIKDKSKSQQIRDEQWLQILELHDYQKTENKKSKVRGKRHYT